MFSPKRVIKFAAIAAAVTGLIFSVTACSETGSTQEFGKNPDTVQSVLTTLNTAKTITMKKAAFSIADSWTVSADGKEVATIKGKTFPVLGDTYSMYAPDGTFVAGEQEQVNILSGNKADTYDYNGKADGSIDAQLFSLTYKFNIKNQAGTTLGTFNQGFAFNLKGDITDQAGKTEWSMSKAMFSIGASISLTSDSTADKDVSGLNAVWTAVIVNEVSEAQSKSHSSSHSD